MRRLRAAVSTKGCVWLAVFFCEAIGCAVFPLHACECIEVSQEKAFESAVVVFRGKVVEIDHLTMLEVTDPATGKSELRPPTTGDHTVVTFAVDGGWKGAVTSIMKVHATFNGTVCPGYIFQKDHEYVVYGTELLNPSSDAIQKLAKGMHVYDVFDCPLRVRTDVQEETKLLGKARVPRHVDQQ